MRSSGVLRIRQGLRRLCDGSSLSAAVVLVIGLIVVLPASASAVSFTFTPIDGPDAFFTQATGINDAGQIVGAFATATGFHGFLYSNGIFALIDGPGADSTFAFGINDAGQITGTFYTVTEQHGFLYTDGVLTLIDGPGASFTSPTGINDSGQAVGTFINPTGGYPFLYSGGVVTTIDAPGGPLGINATGQIVGFFNNPGEVQRHGFLYTGGVFTTIDVPGADTFETEAWGIDDSGQIVGAFTTYVRRPDGYFDIRTHGFLDTGGVFTTIDVPGAVLTQAIGINTTGQIVGAFRNEMGTHGFLATPTGVPAPSTLLLLDTGLALGAAWTRIRRRSGRD